jgi:kinesin family protein 22
LEISLELYRKARTYVPDNVKLRERCVDFRICRLSRLPDTGNLENRIIEMEWAVKNNKPLLLSPKRARKSSRHSRPKRSGRTSRQKSNLPSVSVDASVEHIKEEDGGVNEGANDASENWRSRTRAGKRKRDPLKEEVTNSAQKANGSLKDQLQDGPVTPPKRPRKGRPGHVESDGDGDGDEWVPATSPRKVRSSRD